MGGIGDGDEVGVKMRESGLGFRVGKRVGSERELDTTDMVTGIWGQGEYWSGDEVENGDKQ